MTDTRVADVRDFNWATAQLKIGVHKEIIRTEAFAEMIRQYRDISIRCLTLPANSWAWEREISVAHPDQQFTVHGCECDKVVYRSSVRHIKEYPIPRVDALVGNCYLLDSLKEKKADPYHLIYADYMGTWNEDKKLDIDTMFRNGRLAPGGIYMMTTMLQRGAKKLKEELKRVLDKSSYKKAIKVLMGHDQIYLSDLRNIVLEGHSGVSISPKVYLFTSKDGQVTKDETDRPLTNTQLIKLAGIPLYVREQGLEYGVDVRLAAIYIYENFDNHRTTEVVYMFQTNPNS